MHQPPENNMKHRFLLALLFIGISCRVLPAIKGEMFHCQPISARRGLSSDRVFSLCKDNLGRLWAATKSGVDCYDGTRLHNYRLFNSEVVEDEMGHKIRLCKDISRGITAYTNTGKVFVFDVFANRFKLQLDLGIALRRPVYLYALTLHGRQAFACTSEGVYEIDAMWHDVRLIYRGKASDIVVKYAYIYVATDSGICRISRTKYPEIRYIFKGTSIQALFVDNLTGLLWAGTRHGGVLLYNLRQDRMVASPQHAPISDKTYRCIIPYDNATLLLGIDGEGVFAASRNGSAMWKLLSTNGPVSARLKSNDVYDLVTDDSGNIWVGTYTEGIMICNLLKSNYRIDQHESGNAQTIINNHVNAVLVDHRQNLWYATDDGLSICSPDGVWRHLYRGKVFLTLCQGTGDNVWTGSYGEGLWQLDTSGRIVKKLTTTNSPLTTNHIYSIYIDRQNNLWTGGLKGTLMCITPQGSCRSFAIDYIHHIAGIGNNRLAIATANGFYTVNSDGTGLCKHFDYPKRYGIKSNSYINFICPQGNNRLWLATDGGGLVLFNTRTGRAGVYTTANGLPSNYVYSVAIDRKGRVWTSTDHGLAYMQHHGKGRAVFSSLSTLNGQVANYKPTAFYKAADGRFYYGSDNGVVSFNPLAFGNYHYAAPLHISGFSVSHPSGKDDRPRDISINKMLLADKEIHLKHDENTFTISFSSISFQYQNDILYTYLMDHFDHAWAVPSHATSARYTNLPPGNYTFHVRSMSQNTGKLIGEATISIHIAHPWWNTVWAWGVYLLLASLAVYSAWRNYTARFERRNFRNKLQFFVNTAHDIRTPVTLIINPLRDLNRSNSLPEADRRLLSLALNSARNLHQFTTELLNFQKMDMSSQGKADIIDKPCNLNACLKELTAACDCLLREKGIRLRLVLPAEETHVWMDRKKIDHVLYNIITNAIKYNRRGGIIVVKLLEGRHNTVIAVRDTGIGIPAESQKNLFTLFYRASNVVDSNRSGNGIGLAFARKTMRDNGGDISFQSTEGRGTTFFIAFPRKRRRRARLWKLLRHGMPAAGARGRSEAAGQTAPAANGDVTPAPQAPDDVPTAAKRLMIVEDNDDLRYYLRHIFEACYHVVDVADGRQALSYLEHQMVDFIISDVMMPGIQGDMLCRKIKQSVATSHIPVILLTAKAGRESMIKGFDCGADDYIPKPFDTEILLAKVHNMMSSREQLRNNIMAKYQLKGHNDNAVAEAGHTGSSAILNDIDRQFLNHCMTFISDNMEKTDFNVNMLCREMAMSRTILYEKLKALTGQSPGELITIVRMKAAARLLLEGHQVQEVAIKTGFTDAAYFSTAFKKHYGVSPSRYKKSCTSPLS